MLLCKHDKIKLKGEGAEVAHLNIVENEKTYKVTPMTK
jgi:hypothetical protein